jgi:hypothetical protein
MNSKLRSLVVGVGIFIVGGVSYSVFRREPPGQSIANLRDAGLFSERTDRFVLACPEKITTATRNYLKNNDYGTFKAGSIHRIARVVIEHTLADGGKELVNPSIDVLANDADGGDEEDETDDALQFRTDDCFRLECDDDTDAGIRELNWLPDGGARHPFPDGGPRPWCNVATRRGRVTPPCVIPDCSLSDGGWDDNGPPVDCYGKGPFGNQDGTPRWRGCNVTPAQFSSAADGGTPSQCYPVECSVVSGDGIDVLR